MEPVSLEERLVLAKEKGFTCAHLASKLIYSEYHIDRHGLTPGLAAHLRRKFNENGIDIAVYGGDFDNFYWDVKEKVNSLLMFDIVQADSSVSNELKKEIQKDGVVIYEKA